MGGNAMKNIGANAIRRSTDFMNGLYDEISPALDRFGIESYMVRAYAEKPDHGDLDILVKTLDNARLVDFIETHECPCYFNNGVISFSYKDTQVDFIKIPNDEWESSKFYFDFDPRGNLVGKIAHKFGVSFGTFGLNYKYRGGDGRSVKDIRLCSDPIKIMKFLGFAEPIPMEFTSLKEIYDFVISSEYFDSDIFAMENLSHIDRKRNSRRPSYHAFLEYIKTFHYKKYDFTADKSVYIAWISRWFPEANLENTIFELEMKDKEDSEIRSKLNGHDVADMFKITDGKLIGEILEMFKQSIDKSSMWKDYRTYALSNSKENIIEDLNLFVKTYCTIDFNSK
jgi:hypothetical protein